MSLWIWVGVPLLVTHLALWRWWRPVLGFQLVLDICLAVVVGPALVADADLNPVRCLHRTRPFDQWSWSEQTQLQRTQSDLVLQFHPWWAEVRRKIGQGEPPWISERLGGGLPLAANGQCGLLAPVMLPVWALGPERGTTVMAAWKIELAGLGAFLLVWKAWRLRWWASVVTGVGAACGTFQIAWLLVPLGWVVALMPWLWWLTWWALGRRRRLRASIAAGLVMGWLLGSGLHPETAVIVIGSSWMAGLVQHPRRWRRLVCMAAVALPLGLALSWPTITYIASSAKAHELASARPNLEPVPLAMRLQAVQQLLVPAVHGSPGRAQWNAPYPYSAAATGIGGVALVLIAAGRARRRHRRLMWAALACLGVAAVLAYRAPPLDWVLVRLPPFDRMTLTRFACLAPWGLTLLAGLGADGLLSGRARHWIWCRAPLAALLGIVIWAAPWDLHTANLTFVLLTVCATLMATLAAPRVPVLAGLMVLELTGLALDVNPVASRADRLPRPELISQLVSRAERHPGRVMGLAKVLPPNMASRYGIEDLRAFDPVRPRSMTALMAMLGEPDPVLGSAIKAAPAGLTGAWGVRYLVTPRAVQKARLEGWARLWTGRSAALWENPRALPIVRVCGEVIRADHDRASELVKQDQLDLSAVTIVPFDAPRVSARRMDLVVMDERAHKVLVETSCDGPCLVVVARPRAPGWRATVDGKQVEIVTTNVAGLGAVAPPGSHRVELRYDPWSW